MGRRALGPAGRRLGILLIAVLLLLGGSFIGLARRDRDAALEEAWTRLEWGVLGAAEHAERSLAAARLVTDRVADTFRREGDAVFRGAGWADLAALLRDAPQIGSLSVLGRDGELLANSLDPDPPGLTVARRTSVAQLRLGADSQLTSMRWGQFSRVWAFSYDRAVRVGGMLVGIVQASMHAEEFQRFQAGLGLGPHGRVGLFRMPDGAPLMLYPLPAAHEPDGPPHSPCSPPEAVIRAATEGVAREGRYLATDADGGPLLVAWRITGDSNEMIAAAAMPQAEALASFQAALMRNVVLFGMAAALVCALGAAVAAALARASASRRAAEAGQRELSAVLEATGEGVIVLEADGRIAFVNSRAALALAFGNVLTGRTLWEAMPELAGGPIWRACEETMLGGRRAEAEGTQAPLGRLCRAEAHPREGGGLIVFFRDVTEEREAAARIADSEARLRRLFHAIDEGYAHCEIIVDESGHPVDIRFLEVNPLFEPMTGLHDAAGRTAMELAPDLEADWIDAFGSVALEGQTRRLELGSDALGRWLDVFATPVAPRGRFALVLRDVTARRQAEHALRDSEAQLRRAEEAGGIGVWMSDLVTGGAFWSPEFRRLIGVPEDMPASREAFAAMVVSEDRELIGGAVRRAVRDEPHKFMAEFRIRRADSGALRWLVARGEMERDAAGRPTRLVGATLDVTERHSAEAAQAESEARLRRVLDNILAFVAVLSPDGTLLEVNREPLDRAGLTIADVRGKPFWECHWWSHDPAGQARLREACARAAAGAVSRYDAEMRARDEERFVIDFQIAPLRDAAGRVTHLIPSATDVTAQRKAEAALAESEARLRLAQEAAEVGVFERVLPSTAAHWSASMFRLHGLDPSTRGPWIEEEEQLGLMHPQDREVHRVRRQRIRADARTVRFEFEFRIRRADTGEMRWLASRGEVVRDAQGKPLIIRGVNQDVTERRRAEERQMLLAREVDHRAKNALAVVQSIVGLTRDTDPERFRAAVIGRIAAMARAHTLLAREGWDAAELRELLEAEVAPHRGKATNGGDLVMLDGPKVALQPGAAQPLAMALHELATNATKYGALSAEAGRVAISWEVGKEGLVLRWSERGGPPLSGPPERRGFGSSVIRNTVERQLGGRCIFEWPPEGLVCTLKLPATHLRRTRGSRTSALQLRS